MKSALVTTYALFLFLSANTANAVPFTFTPGQPARASDVNANFTNLETLINTNATNIATNAGNIATNAANVSTNTANISTNTANIATNTADIATNAADIAANTAAIAAIPGLTTYDYRNYAADSTITSKTFAITGISTCDTEVRNFAHVTVGSDSTTTMTRVRTQSSAPCQYAVFKFLSTPTGNFMLSEDVYTNDGGSLTRSVTLDTPALLQSSNMRNGITIADAATTTITGGSKPTGTYVERTTVVGVESITVPYGTLNNCLKVHSSRETSEGFGSGDLSRISWLCPGIGMAKRIQANGGTWMLTNVTQ